MAKEKEDAQQPETPPAASGSPPAAAPQQAQPTQIQIDDASVVGSYANFCRVTGSPEELIIDFGLNPQPMNPTQGPIKVDRRIIVNYYTAKRLLGALQMSVHRHESAFGALETDVQKRVRTQPGG